MKKFFFFITIIFILPGCALDPTISSTGYNYYGLPQHQSGISARDMDYSVNQTRAD